MVVSSTKSLGLFFGMPSNIFDYVLLRFVYDGMNFKTDTIGNGLGSLLLCYLFLPIVYRNNVATGSGCWESNILIGNGVIYDLL